ncbi:MAG: flagellar biosynthetic protein FliR [Desulfobacterales bacterium]|nr:flagellar biosynthetic protein FliR [Desulfobacterales bacterium]
MEILHFPTETFRIFLLVLLRVSTFLFLFPFFGSPVVPMRVKAATSMILAFALMPVATDANLLFPESAGSLAITAGAEIIMGTILGLSTRIFFAAVQLAGQIISFQMGFSMISIMDPQSGSPMTIMSQIGYLTAMILFLSFGGHHVILGALADSFTLVSTGGITLSSDLWKTMSSLTLSMFTLGIRMAAPCMAALFFTTCAFGMCARFVPQMNVLVLAFPVKIAVGLALFGLTLTAIHLMVGRFTAGYTQQLTHLMQMLGR